jgi:hypothetical protein
MTKFLVLTQNTIVPGFLEEKSPVDMSVGTEKKGRKYCNFAQRKPTVFFSLGIGGFEFCPKYPKTD